MTFFHHGQPGRNIQEASDRGSGIPILHAKSFATGAANSNRQLLGHIAERHLKPDWTAYAHDRFVAVMASTQVVSYYRVTGKSWQTRINQDLLKPVAEAPACHA